MMEENSLTQTSSKTAPLAFIFDVDGVITDPVEKTVTEKTLFDFIESYLKRGIPITLNTGRSNEWIIKHIINPLTQRLKDKKDLKNFFSVCENGLTWISFSSDGDLLQGVFDPEGKLVEGFDLAVFLDPETAHNFEILNHETKKLIDEKYSHSTFFDTTKKAMVTAEMKDGYSVIKFADEQVQFTQELRNILKKEGTEDKFNVDPTTIATNIQLPSAGKHLGTKRILDWLKRQNLNPQHFYTFGDSQSDIEMAEKLYSQGKSVDFYYVNPEKPLNLKRPFKILITNGEFEKGTIEVLQSILAKY